MPKRAKSETHLEITKYYANFQLLFVSKIDTVVSAIYLVNLFQTFFFVIYSSQVSNDQQQAKVEANRKLLSSKRKLDQPQDLTAPDIVTWLPVLLTASSSQTAQQPQSKLTNGCNEASTTNETQIIAQDEQNGQKTLGEDGLVFRSPEMKRSLQRKKKKMKKSKNRPQDRENSSQDSDNSDSFYETLRKHQRKNRTNSTKTNNNNTTSSAKK